MQEQMNKPDPTKAENARQSPRKKTADKSSAVSVIHDISRAAVRVRDISAMLESVFEILGERANLKNCSVLLRSGDALTVFASNAEEGYEIGRVVCRMGEGVEGESAAEGKPKIASRNNAAVFCAPVLSGNSAIGALSAESAQTPEKPEKTLAVLETCANILADSLTVAHLERGETVKLNSENRELRKKIDFQNRPENAVGNTSAMVKMYALIERAADSSAHVLIRGEVGAGKDFAMRAIADSKQWRDKPLEILDCSTMRDSLIEAELFGTQNPQKQGLVEKAGAGIVYLDSIGLIGKPLQVKLLKYLSSGVFEKVGAMDDTHGRARIIASTSGDLETRMRDGIIRPDFYYQITTFTIAIPPLRQRRRDIPALAKFFLQKHARLREKKVLSIGAGAMNMLCDYHWPSNVRELENCIERAVIIAAGQAVTEGDLPPSLQTPQSTNSDKTGNDIADFEKRVAEFERDIILDALAANGGNASAAARQLSVSRRILNYKLESLGVSPSAFKPRRR